MDDMQFISRSSALLQKIQRGVSNLELVYTPHNRWPLKQSSLSPTTRDILRISVLDSSFNPPTLAHLALANSPLPRCSDNQSLADESLNCDYDAKLLLLSVRNVDKSLKPGDATYLQRLQMMVLLAKDVVFSVPDAAVNVAVAITNEPTFVGKSTALLSFLSQNLPATTLANRNPGVFEHETSIKSVTSNLSETTVTSSEHLGRSPPVQLTFLQGFDTLERLFSDRYYPSQDAMWQSLHRFFSSDGENCRVVCARRASSSYGVDPDEERVQAEKTILLAKDFIDSKRLILIDIGENEQTLSSSEVRRNKIGGDENWKKLTTERIVQYIIDNNVYPNMDH